MKKIKPNYKLRNKIFIVLLGMCQLALAQPGPGDLGSPPDLPGGGTPMGATAPLDGGTLILIGFALIYLAYNYRMKILALFKKQLA